MSQNEENLLIEYIKSMDLRRLVSKYYIIKKIANFLLAERGDSVFNTIGQNWINCFIVYIPDIVSCLFCRYNYQYTKYKNPKTIQK